MDACNISRVSFLNMILSFCTIVFRGCVPCPSPKPNMISSHPRLIAAAEAADSPKHVIFHSWKGKYKGLQGVVNGHPLYNG